MNGDERGTPRFDKVDEALGNIQSSMPPDPTTYNKQKQQEAMRNKIKDIQGAVASIEAEMKGDGYASIYGMMDQIEKVIYYCGGENKVAFMDVTHSFIKIQTRVPMSANLYQFMPEDNSNPRFHKVVTKILLISKYVSGVRWLPADQGAYLLVSLNFGVKP